MGLRGETLELAMRMNLRLLILAWREGVRPNGVRRATSRRRSGERLAAQRIVSRNDCLAERLSQVLVRIFRAYNMSMQFAWIADEEFTVFGVLARRKPGVSRAGEGQANGWQRKLSARMVGSVRRVSRTVRLVKRLSQFLVRTL